MRPHVCWTREPLCIEIWLLKSKEVYGTPSRFETHAINLFWHVFNFFEWMECISTLTFHRKPTGLEIDGIDFDLLGHWSNLQGRKWLKVLYTRRWILTHGTILFIMEVGLHSASTRKTLESWVTPEIMGRHLKKL